MGEQRQLKYVQLRMARHEYKYFPSRCGSPFEGKAALHGYIDQLACQHGHKCATSRLWKYFLRVSLSSACFVALYFFIQQNKQLASSEHVDVGVNVSAIGVVRASGATEDFGR